jgi:hypothetical protein
VSGKWLFASSGMVNLIWRARFSELISAADPGSWLKPKQLWLILITPSPETFRYHHHHHCHFVNSDASLFRGDSVMDTGCTICRATQVSTNLHLCMNCVKWFCIKHSIHSCVVPFRNLWAVERICYMITDIWSWWLFLGSSRRLLLLVFSHVWLSIHHFHDSYIHCLRYIEAIDKRCRSCD